MSFWEVTEWGYHEFLVAEAGLDEVERIEVIRRRDRALHAAQLITVAVWEPQKLGDEARSIERLIGGAGAKPAPARQAELDEVIAFQERVARRKRRQGNGG